MPSKPKQEPPWNRCDWCGKFIAMKDFDHGAIRTLVAPDSHFTAETYETLCKKHGHCGPPMADLNSRRD